VTFSDADLEYLLQRPVRQLLTDADRKGFAGRRVLITGAGGSIGSALARQLAPLGVQQLILLDQSELSLFQIERDLSEGQPGVPLEPVLSDVSRPGTLAQVCRAWRPHVVFHAAAYKHVTMAERAVCATVEANVLGTLYAADAAREAGARFVLISSDKAANPQSVMGATKRLAELVVHSRAAKGFEPVVVRFGNVLGSSGSLLTIMRERVRAGRTIPLTDPDATRYFMSAGEAVSLVLKTERLASRAETYWLDMGAPIRIGNLADRLLALEARHGFAPVPIEVIGLRPGEKLREELTNQGLRMCPTRHRRIWVARQPPAERRAIDASMRVLRRAVLRGDASTTLALLGRMVADYTPSAHARACAEAQSARVQGPSAVGHRRSA
jgi:FlaA1/EpsC-like NDP-sugar epimerase